jgi:hypothetical protein
MLVMAAQERVARHDRRVRLKKAFRNDAAWAVPS